MNLRERGFAPTRRIAAAFEKLASDLARQGPARVGVPTRGLEWLLVYCRRRERIQVKEACERAPAERAHR
jgi:hypothetical protein